MSVSYSSDSVNDSVVWEYNKATPGWTEGQIHIRSFLDEHEEKYLDWNITIMGIKPGNLEAFIAIDDFAFHPTDICETKPQDAGFITTTTPVVPCSNDEFTCNDGSCVPIIEGCTNPEALNYNPEANTEDFSCEEIIYGCTDPQAANYDEESKLVFDVSVSSDFMC